MLIFEATYQGKRSFVAVLDVVVVVFFFTTCLTNKVLTCDTERKTRALLCVLWVREVGRYETLFKAASWFFLNLVD
jgi:hypothetical protein